VSSSSRLRIKLAGDQHTRGDGVPADENASLMNVRLVPGEGLHFGRFSGPHSDDKSLSLLSITEPHRKRGIYTYVIRSPWFFPKPTPLSVRSEKSVSRTGDDVRFDIGPTPFLYAPVRWKYGWWEGRLYRFDDLTRKISFAANVS
jgi:hypothetical protein